MFFQDDFITNKKPSTQREKNFWTCHAYTKLCQPTVSVRIADDNPYIEIFLNEDTTLLRKT